MTVRAAELTTGVVTILMSIALMYKSAENSIWWVPGTGPGSGAWPFWLSAVLLLTSCATLVRGLLRITPESRNTEPFIDPQAIYIVAVTIGSLIFLLGATQIIGIYFALMLFLLFYLKVVGGHGWTVTIAMMFGTPIFIFALFEYALTISLPKGISEPLFYPLYALMY